MRQPPTDRPSVAPLDWIRRFGRDEDGSMLIFGMFILIMMLMVGGMAVDLMRYETNRTHLQATLDRAILAGAELNNTEALAEAVTRDYLAKAGLADYVINVDATGSVNSRTVEATAAIELDTFFMDLVGIETLEAPAAGTATESVNNIEIVLVLDVSGSMGSNSRLINLRSAARDFVTTMLEDDPEHRVSISIVPFNAQVNLGPTLFDQYNITNEHGAANSWCVDLPPSVYSSPGISTSLPMPQAGFFDSVQTSSQANSYEAPVRMRVDGSGRPVNLTCRIDTNAQGSLVNAVRLPQQDIATLHRQIQALTAVGNTSITLGMKWGLAMLDPGSRAMFDSLITERHMPETLRGRPYAYENEEMIKVIVLMTDGDHVSSTYLNPGYRTELSQIYRADSGDRGYSIYHPDRPGLSKYWVPSLSSWQLGPWRGNVLGLGTASQLRWNEVWSNLSMRWVAWQLYARALGTDPKSRSSQFNTWFKKFQTPTEVPAMNSSLQQSCNLARQNGVMVYGIAFEAPTDGRTQIRSCSTTPSHFYDARGLQIRTVFQSIAAQINTLRLVD